MAVPTVLYDAETWVEKEKKEEKVEMLYLSGSINIRRHEKYEIRRYIRRTENSRQ